MKSANDLVIEEIHETRREIARRFNFDIRKIADDARRRQALEGRTVWYPESTNKAIHPSGGGTISGSGESTPAAG